MIRGLVAVLALALVGYPLTIQPATWVLVAAGVALVLCAVGVAARLSPVVTAGIIVALAEYALALSLADGRRRLGGALVAGVIAALLLETADFERRFRHVAIGRGVVAAQVRYWVGLGVLGGGGTLLAVVGALVISSMRPLPWPAVVAVLGAVATLVAAAAALVRGARGGLIVLAVLTLPLDAVT